MKFVAFRCFIQADELRLIEVVGVQPSSSDLKEQEEQLVFLFENFMLALILAHLILSHASLNINYFLVITHIYFDYLIIVESSLLGFIFYIQSTYCFIKHV